jgi:hypothetical protein
LVVVQLRSYPWGIRIGLTLALLALLSVLGLAIRAWLQERERAIVIRQNTPATVEWAPVIDNRQAMPRAQRASPSQAASTWTERVNSMNQADWRKALAVANDMAKLPPEEGLAVVRENWTTVTNAESRKQFLKAFTFANHPKLIPVLEMGVLDPAPPVQAWGLSYLRDVALEDFAEDFAGAKSWLAANRDKALKDALADSARAAAARLRDGNNGRVLKQLSILRNPLVLRDNPEAIVGSGLEEALERLVIADDKRVVEGVFNAAIGVPLSESWYQRVALPKIQSGAPLEVRASAATLLQFRGGLWAVDPLLNALTNLLTAPASERRLLFSQFSGALGELGAAKAIPAMIGIIDADNTYDTIYGVGYFGLSKLTGVTYDEKHDGAWWRAWWEKNKERFAGGAEALEIPALPPVRKSTSARQSSSLNSSPPSGMRGNSRKSSGPPSGSAILP